MKWSNYLSILKLQLQLEVWKLIIQYHRSMVQWSVVISPLQTCETDAEYPSLSNNRHGGPYHACILLTIPHRLCLFSKQSIDVIFIKRYFADRGGQRRGFPNVIGAIDCTHVPLQRPNEIAGNHPMEPDFINRHNHASLNVQVRLPMVKPSAQIPQCTGLISHIIAFLLQNGSMCNIFQIHRRIFLDV